MTNKFLIDRVDVGDIVLHLTYDSKIDHYRIVEMPTKERPNNLKILQVIPGDNSNRGNFDYSVQAFNDTLIYQLKDDEITVNFAERFIYFSNFFGILQSFKDVLIEEEI